jgi:hypothetical protein
MLCGKMALLMVGQFISFIPDYLFTAPGLLMHPAQAAKASAIFTVRLFVIITVFVANIKVLK